MLSFRPATEEALLAAARAVRGRPTRENDTIVARIDYGRWLGDCVCGAGVAIHPGWTKTGCTECGRVLTVTAPSNVAEIENALLERSMDDQRHWVPGKTVEQLREETARMARNAAEARAARERTPTIPDPVEPRVDSPVDPPVDPDEPRRGEA